MCTAVDHPATLGWPTGRSPRRRTTHRHITGKLIYAKRRQAKSVGSVPKTSLLAKERRNHLLSRCVANKLWRVRPKCSQIELLRKSLETKQYYRPVVRSGFPIISAVCACMLIDTRLRNKARWCSDRTVLASRDPGSDSRSSSTMIILAILVNYL